MTTEMKVKFISEIEDIPPQHEARHLVVFFEDGAVYGSDTWRVTRFSEQPKIIIYDYDTEEEAALNTNMIDYIMVTY